MGKTVQDYIMIIIMKIRKREMTEEIELSNLERIRTLDEKENH